MVIYINVILVLETRKLGSERKGFTCTSEQRKKVICERENQLGELNVERKGK